MNRIVCADCGRTEDDHCVFRPKAMPDGCVCQPGEWNEVVPPVCKEFVGDPRCNCATCEHNMECHKK